jgi:hypothetical protein
MIFCEFDAYWWCLPGKDLNMPVESMQMTNSDPRHGVALYQWVSFWKLLSRTAIRDGNDGSHHYAITLVVFS